MRSDYEKPSKLERAGDPLEGALPNRFSAIGEQAVSNQYDTEVAGRRLVGQEVVEFPCDRALETIRNAEQIGVRNRCEAVLTQGIIDLSKAPGGIDPGPRPVKRRRIHIRGPYPKPWNPAASFCKTIPGDSEAVCFLSSGATSAPGHDIITGRSRHFGENVMLQVEPKLLVAKEPTDADRQKALRLGSKRTGRGKRGQILLDARATDIPHVTAEAFLDPFPDLAVSGP